MKKTALLLAGFIVFALLFVLFRFDALARSPFETRIGPLFPSQSALDASGKLYLVDSGTRRVLAFDSEGYYRWHLEGGKRRDGFYYAYGLALDREGRLYVYNDLPENPQEGNAENYQILRYDQDGRYEGVVFDLALASGTPELPDYFSFFLEDDALFYLVGRAGAFTITRVDLASGESAAPFDFPAPGTGDSVVLYGTGPGRLAAVDRDGSLLLLDSRKTWHRVRDGHLKKPWDIKFSAQGDLYVLDLLAKKILRYDSYQISRALLSVQGEEDLLSLNPETVLGLSPSARGGNFGDAFSLAADGTVLAVEKEGPSLIYKKPSGPERSIPYLTYSTGRIIEGLFVWLVAILGFGAALVLLGLFLVLRRKGRIPLLATQILIFVPIIVAAQLVSFNQVYQSLYEHYRQEVRFTLSNASVLGARLVPGRDLARLDSPDDLDSETYRSVDAAAAEILSLGTRMNAVSYLSLYRKLGDEIYVVYTASGSFGVLYPYSIFPAQALETFDGGPVRFAEYEDDYGLYEAAFAPVYADDGSVAGVLETGLFADLLKDLENAYLNDARIFAASSGVLFVVLFVILTTLILRALNPLRRFTREMAEGKLDLPIDFRGKDELGLLGKDFNAMAARLKNYVQDIQALTEASARFVPVEFITLLGVSDLSRLRLGDQTNREMTVLFSSVRNFRKISGHHSSQGVFNYLNSYLKVVSPRIRDAGGLIDKYMGDTYMALFPRHPLDALKAVVSIQRDFDDYNRRRQRSGSEPLSLGFGLHFGRLMLGIVGEKERLEGTVIADAVNLASRLNGLGRIYGVGTVLSQSTLLQAAHPAGSSEEAFDEEEARTRLLKLRETYPFRRLDYAIVKGKTEPVLLYELLDESNPANQPLFPFLDRYERAFEHYLGGRVKEAAEGFDALLALRPEDPVLRRHAERCGSLARDGLPEGWSPAVKLTEK